VHHSRSSLAFLSVSHHGVLGVESLEASCVSAGDGGHAVVTVLPKQVIPPLLSILHWGFPAAWDGTSGVADDVVVKMLMMVRTRKEKEEKVAHRRREAPRVRFQRGGWLEGGLGGSHPGVAPAVHWRAC